METLSPTKQCLVRDDDLAGQQELAASSFTRAATLLRGPSSDVDVDVKTITSDVTNALQTVPTDTAKQLVNGHEVCLSSFCSSLCVYDLTSCCVVSALHRHPTAFDPPFM